MRVFSRTLLALAVMMVLVGFAAPVLAAFEYQPLENGVPGFESETASGNFVSYVESIYKLGLWIVGISALFMFSVGAFTYLSSAGNTSAMGTGKSVMKDALIGLLLALASWLLLNTINPDLVNINIGSMNASGGGGVGSNLPQAPGGSSDGGSAPAPKEGTYTNDEAVKVLSEAGISVKSSGNCSDQKNKNCTSLQDIPKDAVSKIIALKKESGCSFNVTGGTEVGHKSHGPGQSRMDVSPEDCVGNFLNTNKSQLSKYGVTQICATSRWQKISYNCGKYVESQPHVHLGF